jgi:opacity protein-like surface antigen
MTLNKNKLALGVAAAALSAAFIAPQAQAADRSADASARKTEALEMKMQEMAATMAAMQAELGRVKAASTEATTASAKVQELDQWMASVKSTPEAASAKDHLVAVRGGFANLDHARGDSNVLNNGALLSNNDSNQGFYFGGAFDFNVNNDLFGLMDDTSFAIELGAEYSQFGQGENFVSNSYVSAVTQGNMNVPTADHKALDARLRVSASPKIKFMHGSKLRPWLIPAGLDINILGVPSNAVSVLNAGLQSGAGVEYDLFRGIVVGTDVRYHYSTSKLDGTPTDGFTTGGYVGFKF